nr:unnamed protein product [Callosobruchus chinensis]
MHTAHCTAMPSSQNSRKQLLIILGAVVITAASLPKCPPNKSSKSIYLPDETNCSRFYECGPDGEPKLQECSEGLDFNPILQVCDYPEHAGCRNKTTTAHQPTQPAKTTKLPSATTKRVTSKTIKPHGPTKKPFDVPWFLSAAFRRSN